MRLRRSLVGGATVGLVVVLFVGRAAAQTGTFTATGSMATPRLAQTATLLVDGHVLVAGGNDAGGPLATAELYDPVSGTFGGTGAMNVARTGQTATLLPSGKVLVTGGSSFLGTVGTAELYDPVSGTFTATGSMNVPRVNHTATLLPDGRVLIAGGFSPAALSGVLNTAEVYDPTTGTFTSTGSMSTARACHTATRLANGGVLVAGGCSAFPAVALASAEIFDPTTGTFSLAAASMASPRRNHAATLLANGMVLLAGGYNAIASATPLASAELFDPASGTFTATGSMSVARALHTATRLSTGSVLVAGGFSNTGVVASADLYDPALGAFAPTGPMNGPRDGHTATFLTNGKVLVAGGQGTVTILASAELFAPPATAALLCVAPGGSGGCFASIQAAIDAASPGSTISIGPGIYTENVVVTKPLTLAGTDEEEVIVRPAVSNPNPCAGSSLCGGAASNIILVQADGVTIHDLTLDGDNPDLTSGIVRDGADLDARNGIITNHLVGRFDRLVVSHVTVRNVYLRGIYASSGGTFDFHHNRVRNVQGDASSVAMFNFGGAGAMAHNVVSFANDAISSNWSGGVHFLGNAVTRSGSGVHTDNAGGFGGPATADVIEGNTVRHCQTDGYGIFVFVPYLAPTVKHNRVHGCTVGLAAFGQGAPVTTPFEDNRVDGASASSSSRANSMGVLVSTDELGYGATDVSVSFTGNVIRHFNTGVYVEQHCELFGSLFNDCEGGGGQATATLHENAIYNNRTGAVGMPGTVVGAENDWWGCSRGPNHPGCDTVSGTVTFTPWLRKPSSVGP